MRYIRVANNVKIAVEDLNPCGKRTILFVHGWPLTHKIFEYQVGRLVKRGYRCVLLDLRGFGRSDTTSDGYCYDRLASDIHEVVNALGLGRFTLVGFSMGGAIVIRYLALFNDPRVCKLALLGAAAPSFARRPDAPDGMSREAIEALLEQATHDRPEMVEAFGKMLFASNPPQSLRDWFQSIGMDTSGIGTVSTLLSLREENLTSDLKKIRVPTGIFHGKLDQICPFSFAQAMHRAIPHSQLFPFEHSGHAVFYDELDRFNREFFAFLEQ